MLVRSNLLTCHKHDSCHAAGAKPLNMRQWCVHQGEPWTSAIAGHELNIVEQGEERKRLTLERFQEEVWPGQVVPLRVM